MLSLTRKQLFPLPEIVGNESDGVRGTDIAFSKTDELLKVDKGDDVDIGGIGRRANGTLSEVVWMALGSCDCRWGFERGRREKRTVCSAMALRFARSQR